MHKFCYLKESESEVAQSCPTLCYPMDCSLQGSSLHGILLARVLEWVAISFSRGSSWPRDRTLVSCIPGRHFNLWATREVCYLIGWKGKNNRVVRACLEVAHVSGRLWPHSFATYCCCLYWIKTPSCRLLYELGSALSRPQLWFVSQCMLVYPGFSIFS